MAELNEAPWCSEPATDNLSSLAVQAQMPGDVVIDATVRERAQQQDQRQG